jgi:hypothetical protein
VALNPALLSSRMLAFMFMLARFGACPSHEHCPSARYAYAANVVSTDLDIFAIGTVSLNLSSST